jgi:alkanesulfonate monooxygenase SsuD/methylene tetrahydromethanopterin reductase-like flavin-dependent oxidoreductase (luciferase family)
VAGTPEECAAAIRALAEAGADSVVLVPATAEIRPRELAGELLQLVH